MNPDAEAVPTRVPIYPRRGRGAAQDDFAKPFPGTRVTIDLTTLRYSTERLRSVVTEIARAASSIDVIGGSERLRAEVQEWLEDLTPPDEPSSHA